MHPNAKLKLYRNIWCAVWTEDGKTVRRSMRTRNYEAALRRFDHWKRLPDGDLIRDAAALYLSAKHDGVVDSERLTNAWKAAGPFFGHLRSGQVTKQLCREYASHRRRLGRRDGTIRRELGMVRAALHYTNQAKEAEFELPSPPAPKDRYLTRTEYRRLLQAALTPHIQLFIVLALATAGRTSAILDLTWDRIDFRRGLIHLSRPGDKRRKGRATVPIVDSLRPFLEAALDEAQTNHVIEYAGAPVKSIKHAFKRTAERAGLSDISPSTIRHTAAVWMAESGRSMSEIAQYLGHRNSQTTEAVYARYSPGYLRQAAAALEIPGGD